jgi:hypothetical protein
LIPNIFDQQNPTPEDYIRAAIVFAESLGYVFRKFDRYHILPNRKSSIFRDSVLRRPLPNTLAPHEVPTDQTQRRHWVLAEFYHPRSQFRHSV